MLFQNNLSFPYVLIYASSLLASVDWKSLLQIDGQVSRNVVERFNSELESMIELESREVFAGRVSFDRKLQRQMQVVDDVYRQTEAMGLKIETDSYGGFGLFNRSQRDIKSGVLKFSIGFLRDMPIGQQNSVDPISVMSRGNDNNFFALTGSIVFVNHSCRAKTQYYGKFRYEGSLCVRLKVIDEILPDEQVTVFSGSDFFDDNNVSCQCPNQASIKTKRAPSRHRRLELPALPESQFHSVIFNFVFVHGREGSDSPTSFEKNVLDIPSSCSANAGLDSIETLFVSKTLWKGKMTKILSPGPLFLPNSKLSLIYWNLTVLAVLELHPKEVLNRNCQVATVGYSRTLLFLLPLSAFWLLSQNIVVQTNFCMTWCEGRD